MVVDIVFDRAKATDKDLARFEKYLTEFETKVSKTLANSFPKFIFALVKAEIIRTKIDKILAVESGYFLNRNRVFDSTSFANDIYLSRTGPQDSKIKARLSQAGLLWYRLLNGYTVYLSKKKLEFLKRMGVPTIKAKRDAGTNLADGKGYSLTFVPVNIPARALTRNSREIKIHIEEKVVALLKRLRNG